MIGRALSGRFLFMRQKARGLGFSKNIPVPESTMADANEEIISFDIFEDNFLDNSKTILDTLTEEEKNEMQNVVTLLESAQTDSLNDFENDTNLLSINQLIAAS